MLLTLAKLGCLLLFAAALAAFAGAWHGQVAQGVAWLAVATVLVHVIELPIFWNVLRTYRGPFAASVALALLFGMLHSLPLKRAARA